MHRVTKTYGHDLGLSAVFRQWRADSHCRYLHGYALSFEFEFEAKELDRNGWVIDFGSMKEIKQKLVDHFDHKLLIAGDDPELERLLLLDEVIGVADVIIMSAVGCEAFAQLAGFWVQRWLTLAPDRQRVRLVRVTVREHGANAASYYPE